jgi:hypothetical protein
MKVWVVLGSWDYEGNDDPLGVYSSKERAEAVAEAERMHPHQRYNCVDVEEYTLDEEPQ